MSFAELAIHPLVERNLHRMGYHEPRPIQREVIPPLLDGRDVIGLAQTGTGKTAAFAVPLAQLLLTDPPPRPRGRPVDPARRLRALVLCPTRELARQVEAEAGEIVRGTVLRTACAYGKAAISPQAAAIARGVDLLVATPGRARELLDSGALSLGHVRHVVIDEADRMLDMGFLPQVNRLLEAIPAAPAAAAPRQIALFTATMPEEIESLARQFLRDPVRIEIGRHTTTVEHVQQRLLPVNDREKVATVLQLIEQGDRSGVLVFCRTRRRVGWVGQALKHHGVSVGMIHGDRSQAQRLKALDRFAGGELRVLVATDVASRGLHVPAVKTVINYDLPLTPEDYVHRVGRAGHGGDFGEAFTLLSHDDRLKWRAILNRTGIEVYAEEISSAIDGADAALKDQRRGREGGGPREVPTSKLASPRDSRRDRQRDQSRRSRKSRPIKKGQAPGRGVKRLQKP